jgi:ABC-type nickel/cobalt efflux system permease component RcnA
MFGLDDSLGGLAQGHGAAVVLLVAFLLGLRHASDPDHLVAVSTLVASTRERATRAASLLGAAWGLGHATTLLAFGVPAILLQAHLPRAVESLAETLIGAIIVLLGVRLLVRWRRGAFHVHEHEHDGASHVHLHAHANEPRHAHAHAPRSPAQAFAVGLVHGMAGSGGVAVLLVAAVPDRRLAVLALLVLVGGTALSMTLMSAVIGRVLGAATARRRLAAAVPVLASSACLFGAWYAVGAALAF